MFNPRNYWERCFKKLNPETYDFSKRKHSTILVSFCDNYLKDGDTVLDLGCGGGRNAHYLAQRGYRVCGADIAKGAVEFCQKRFSLYNLSGTFKQGTFDHIPFPDDYFSGVICVDSLDHTTFVCAQASIVEIRRVLAPGGMVLLTFDPPDTDEDILNEAEVLADETLKFAQGEQEGMLFHRYKDKEIKSLLGEQNIILFDYTKSGARVVICK
ncbi:methyltransferase domain-containing protein [candidate division WOR-3 bacterium]|nr:methyltransferase domain-containing protein [candidate division WOR-3 bacterium]